MIDKQRLYLSSIAQDAAKLAGRFGIGLELAHFCTASNMDEDFAQTDAAVREDMKSTVRFVFHAPFNELYPAAIDPRARALAMERLTEAARLAHGYGISKMVVHSGYVPLVYHKVWHEARSVEFWRELLEKIPPEMVLCVENVMEDEPMMIAAIADAVDDPRFCLCLDVGHTNVCARGVPAQAWVEAFAPHLAHMHIHNNDGARDGHCGLFDGTLDVVALMRQANRLSPNATFTIESIQAQESLARLFDEGIVG